VKKERFLKIALKTEENCLKQCESVPERKRVLEQALLITLIAGIKYWGTGLPPKRVLSAQGDCFQNQAHPVGVPPRKGSQILRICFWRGAEQPRRLAVCGQTVGPERVSAEPRQA
jgi:hypothetical protein